MDSTIAFCVNKLNNQRMYQTGFIKKILTLCLLIAFFVVANLFLSSSNSLAEEATRFSVTSVTASAKNNGTDTLSRFELSLSSTAFDAINHGVPIDIVLSYAEPQKRFWGSNFKPIDRTVFSLSRHALSNSYQLHNSTTFRTHQFITIDDALKHISLFQIKRLERIMLEKLAVRVHLDLFTLPAQIRANAFFSKRWKHDSQWTIWSVS